jgi:hypothetical protein
LTTTLRVIRMPASPPFARESCPRTVHVERGDAEHARRGERDAAAARAWRRAGGGERCEIDGVTRDTRPHRGRRPRAVAEDGDAAQQLAHAVESDQVRVAAITPYETRHELRREDLDEAERDAEPAEALRKTLGTWRL